MRSALLRFLASADVTSLGTVGTAISFAGPFCVRGRLNGIILVARETAPIATVAVIFG